MTLKLHPSELRCTFRARLYPIELRSTLLNNADTLLSYAATLISCILMSYAALYWAMLHCSNATPL
jgi:hypothetical protein